MFGLFGGGEDSIYKSIQDFIVENQSDASKMQAFSSRLRELADDAARNASFYSRKKSR